MMESLRRAPHPSHLRFKQWQKKAVQSPQRPGGQYYSDCSTWPCYGEGVPEAYERACDTQRTLDAGSERCGCCGRRRERDEHVKQAVPWPGQPTPVHCLTSRHSFECTRHRTSSRSPSSSCHAAQRSGRPPSRFGGAGHPRFGKQRT